MFHQKRKFQILYKFYGGKDLVLELGANKNWLSTLSKVFISVGFILFTKKPPQIFARIMIILETKKHSQIFYS